MMIIEMKYLGKKLRRISKWVCVIEKNVFNRKNECGYLIYVRKNGLIPLIKKYLGHFLDRKDLVNSCLLLDI